MKIGILTFHWGTNYGGVLQAYALQKFLEQKGHEVTILNYAPHTFRDTFIKCFYSKNPFQISENLKDFWKEKNIAKFRKKYLVLSKRYYTPESLLEDLPEMDVYITGSDQVWNPYGLKSNKKIYFLPFNRGGSIKLAYAVSFGVQEYPENSLSQIKDLIADFNAIGVREDSGLKILSDAGINWGIVLPDPTLLLTTENYLALAAKKQIKPEQDFFFYVLQKDQKIISEIYRHLKKRKQNKIVYSETIKHKVMGVEEWLYNIKNSKLVITNSFHGIVFSILFKTPFLAIPIEGKLSGMNDRIHTLLGKLDLNERIVINTNIPYIEKLINTPIDWENTNIKLEKLKDTGNQFIENNLKSIN